MQRRKVALVGGVVAAALLATGVVLSQRHSTPPATTPPPRAAALGDQWIIYTVQGAGGRQLWRVSTTTGERLHIKTVGQADVASISRDRRSFAYVRTPSDGTESSKGPLRLATFDGADTALLKDANSCGLARQRVSWGPADAQLAIRCPGADEGLYLRDKTGELSLLAKGVARAPTFTPDGKYVVSWRERGDPGYETDRLFVVSSEPPGNFGEIAASKGAPGAPNATWSYPAWAPEPSGAYRLAFLSQPNGSRTITLYTATFTPARAGGGTLSQFQPVLDRPDLDSPTWSPDGKEIAFQEGNQLCVVPAAGGSPHCPVEGLAPHAEPVWSAF